LARYQRDLPRIRSLGAVAASANMLNFSRFENAHAFDAKLAVTADNLRWSQTGL
jgi:hypothetical protein